MEQTKLTIRLQRDLLEQAKKYAADGKKATGNQALLEMAEAEKAFKDMAVELSGNALKSGKIQEQVLKKEIFESLDDLIAETIRDIKKNKKIT